MISQNFCIFRESCSHTVGVYTEKFVARKLLSISSQFGFTKCEYGLVSTL